MPTDSTGAPLIALSADGTLLYTPPGTTLTRIVFVTRDGAESQMTEPGPTAYFPKLSRDGREVVVATGDADRRWQASSHGGTQPVWDSNGRELFNREGTR